MVSKQRWYSNGSLKRLAAVIAIVSALATVAYSYGQMTAKLEGVEKSVQNVETRVGDIEKILMGKSNP